MKQLATLHDLLVDELKDLLNAEKQLIKALPRMARAATSDKLSTSLEDHLAETEQHVKRLEEALAELDAPARGKKCKGMEGLIEEGTELLEEDGDADVIDAGIIGAAQKVEHYEISAYGTAIAHAKAMGHSAVEKLLKQTLDEEYAADKKLSRLAETSINRLATTRADDVAADAEEESRSSSRRTRERSESWSEDLRA